MQQQGAPRVSGKRRANSDGKRIVSDGDLNINFAIEEQ